MVRRIVYTDAPGATGRAWFCTVVAAVLSVARRRIWYYILIRNGSIVITCVEATLRRSDFRGRFAQLEVRVWSSTEAIAFGVSFALCAIRVSTAPESGSVGLRSARYRPVRYSFPLGTPPLVTPVHCLVTICVADYSFSARTVLTLSVRLSCETRVDANGDER